MSLLTIDSDGSAVLLPLGVQSCVMKEEKQNRKEGKGTVTVKTSMAFAEHKKPARTWTLWVTDMEVSSETTRKSPCLSLAPTQVTHGERNHT